MERITEEKVRQLLDLFVYRENGRIHNEIRQPFLRNGCICAMGSFAFIRIARNFLPNDDFHKIEKYNITWPEPIAPIKLSCRIIDMAIENLPMVDEYTEKNMEITCPDCNGTREVKWEYQDLDGETHYNCFACPVCDGKGKIERVAEIPTGEITRNGNYLIMFRNRYFKARNLLLLRNAMEICGVEEVSVNGESWHLLSVEITEGIDMLIVKSENPEHLSYIEII